jgi:hypothetical protein
VRPSGVGFATCSDPSRIKLRNEPSKCHVFNMHLHHATCREGETSAPREFAPITVRLDMLPLTDVSACSREVRG